MKSLRLRGSPGHWNFNGSTVHALPEPESLGKKKERKKLASKIEKLGRRLEKSMRKQAALSGGSVAVPIDAVQSDQSGWVSPETEPSWGAGPVEAPGGMDVLQVMSLRRSIKRFTSRVVSRADIDRLLQAAALAPNHRMTQPWRFYVLGPHARREYGEALGARKAKKLDDAAAAAQVAAKVAAENEALPAVIAVAMKVSADPEQLREDFAATFMGVQNLCLAAVTAGLGTHIKTGAIMDDPAARAAVGVAEDERIVAIVNLGEPDEVPAPKMRAAAAELTVWRD
jgi:nitroreductase